MNACSRPDAGLQPERTALAWRRTALSLGLGSLISLRVLPPVLGPWSLIIGFVGLALTVLLWSAAGRRDVRTVRAFREGKRLPDGGLALHVSIAVTVVGALALVYVLHAP